MRILEIEKKKRKKENFEEGRQYRWKVKSIKSGGDPRS